MRLYGGAMLGCAVLLLAGSGCVVPQPRGGGSYERIQEPNTRAWYHLYLPAEYMANGGRYPDGSQKRWPLVMTFHGMKPYDKALSQEREWEHEADIYGYVICAPELETCDSFMQYPLVKEHDYVLKDKQNVMAVMDHVFAHTRADPNAVLATSWSCGGYLAHYFVNRFPGRFSCLAVRLSNFAAELLDESTVPVYRNVPVAVFIGDGDLPACKHESELAVAWYSARGFRNLRGKVIDNMGHRRIPQTAAAFFAEHLGIRPLRPLEAAETVARVQMTDFYPDQALLSKVQAPPESTVDASTLAMLPGVTGTATPASEAMSKPPPRMVEYMTSGRNYPFERRTGGAGSSREDQIAGTTGRAGRSSDTSPPRRGAAETDTPEPVRPAPSSVPRTSAAAARSKRVNIRIPGPIVGTAPHYIAYAADLQDDEARGADFLWMDNGVWIGDEPTGVKILETPGQHRISVLIITRQNAEYRGSAIVHVLKRDPGQS